MTTNIRDLLGQVIDLQLNQQTGPADSDAATDARLAIGAAAGVLDKLQIWRPDWTPRHAARKLTEQLQAACAYVQAGNDPRAESRSQTLMAAAGDAVGTLCGSATSALDRWTITLTVAEVVRHSGSTYTANGPMLPDPAITAARTAAASVARAGLHMPPHQLHRALIDLPIPGRAYPTLQPLSRATAAAAVIDYALARGAADDSTHFVSLYELRALALAFEHTTRQASTALNLPGQAAATAWAKVRQLARLLRDGHQPVIDGPEILLRNAADLHHNLAQHSHQPLDPADQPALTELLLHVANSADSLARHTLRMAGRVYTRADQFPVPESRVQQHLQRQPIIADSQDLAVLRCAVRAAEGATADLINPTVERAGMEIGLGPYPLTVAMAPPFTQPAHPIHSPLP
ncbi:MAG: hypothetical protein ACJ74U_15240 [Jatrophihabitantaceae bacterium]